MRPGADSVKDKGQIAEFVSTRYVGEGKMNVHPERMKDSSLKRVEPRIISSLRFIGYGEQRRDFFMELFIGRLHY